MNAVRPVIGIPSRHMGQGEWCDRNHSSRSAFVLAVERAGGEARLVAGRGGQDSVLAAMAGINGLLLPGGIDVAPHQFGESPHPALGAVDEEQDWIELLMARQSLAADLPIFGICRGIQMINVAAGGTLYQDIEAQVPGVEDHKANGDPGTRLRHFVIVVPGTLLDRIAGAAPLHVNTRHHQAVKDVAPGFIVSGRSDDGVIEALEKPASRFVLGVQWHPEYLWPSDPRQLALFTAFVEAARCSRA